MCDNVWPHVPFTVPSWWDAVGVPICLLYDASDRLLARRLAADLKAVGVDARPDVLAMHPRDQLGERLGRLLGCGAVLVLISRALLERGWGAEAADPRATPWRVNGLTPVFARVDDVPWPTALDGWPCMDASDYSAKAITILGSMLGGSEAKPMRPPS